MLNYGKQFISSNDNLLHFRKSVTVPEYNISTMDIEESTPRVDIDEGVAGDSTWMSPAQAKACIALGLFCGTMLFATIPVLLSRRSHGRRNVVRHVLTGLSCLGGGVFLATCFLHLLPEAVEKMEAALKAVDYDTDFPLPNAVVIGGFLLVLLLEQVSFVIIIIIPMIVMILIVIVIPGHPHVHGLRGTLSRAPSVQRPNPRPPLRQHSQRGTRRGIQTGERRGRSYDKVKFCQSSCPKRSTYEGWQQSFW